MQGENRAAVSVDDFRESYKMTDYLISLGHRDIAIITAPREDESIGKLRLLGYKKALEDHGIPYREALVSFMDMNENGNIPFVPDTVWQENCWIRQNLQRCMLLQILWPSVPAEL